MSADNFTHEFVTYVGQKLERGCQQIERCVRLLSDAECWQRANPSCNSVGNLILHLTGNVRQWILSGLGGEPFARNRPAEFAERGPRPREELVAGFDAIVQRAVALIQRLSAAQLGARYTIQEYNVSGIVAICHVVEHFSFHVGQIVHMTKALKNVDLSLYDAQGHRQPGEPP